VYTSGLKVVFKRICYVLYITPKNLAETGSEYSKITGLQQTINTKRSIISITEPNRPCQRQARQVETVKKLKIHIV